MKPIIKWTGGKRWLIPVFKDVWLYHSGSKLVEPLYRGMAVALGLNPQSAILNDANEHLVNFYQQVSRGLQIRHKLHNEENFYYTTRERFNELIKNKQYTTKQAAIFFFII